MQMIVRLALGLAATLSALTAFSEDAPAAPRQEKVAVKDGDIVKIVIADFNWERHVTTTYVVEPGTIRITDNSKEPLDKKVDTTARQDKTIRAALDAIDTVYKGRYSDEHVYDGVNITFTFHLKDGTALTTSIHHLRIDSYAKLTKYLSTIVDPDIQYHQYKMRRITEDD